MEVDHIEAYAQGRIDRRDFVRRGAVIGLSMPFMSAIIAACGSSSSDGSSEGGASTSAAASGGDGATTTAAAAAGSIKQGGTLRVASQKPGGPLDPVKMAELGSYTIVTVAFEYLCGPGEGAELGPMLAESWKPNADGSVWTFTLRKNVKWHDGTPFTADDVVASMDRLAGSNLKAYIVAGATKAVDPTTVEVTLNSPDGQFPYQVSIWNPQSVITPKSFVAGSTLDQAKTGTGAFKLEKYDPATGATFVRNDDWWGGKPFLDKVEFIFSDDLATQISGLQGGAADAIVQFSVIGGDAILNDPNLVVTTVRGAAHRQIWMNTREGDFTDKKVRQAVALGLDRQGMMDTLFKGKADIGNDHPVAPVYSFFDKSQAQKARDVAKAKQLLTEAGKAGLKQTLYAPKLQEIPQLAELVQSQLKEIGLDITLDVSSTDTFYDNWCKVYDSKTEPAGCDGGKNFGIVDYGHRGHPRRVPRSRPSSHGGDWNSSQYKSERAVPTPPSSNTRRTLDLDRLATAAMRVHPGHRSTKTCPAVIPYFYNYDRWATPTRRRSPASSAERRSARCLHRQGGLHRLRSPDDAVMQRGRCGSGADPHAAVFLLGFSAPAGRTRGIDGSSTCVKRLLLSTGRDAVAPRDDRLRDRRRAARATSGARVLGNQALPSRTVARLTTSEMGT